MLFSLKGRTVVPELRKQTPTALKGRSSLTGLTSIAKIYDTVIVVAENRRTKVRTVDILPLIQAVLSLLATFFMKGDVNFSDFTAGATRMKKGKSVKFSIS